MTSGVAGTSEKKPPVQDAPPTTGHRAFSEAEAAVQAPTQYQVAVYTGNVPGAGTDGDVWLWFDGTGGRSGWLYLDNPDDNFERNQTDYFYFSLADLGIVSAAWIYFVPQGDYADWFLSTVTINGTTFSYYKWLENEGLVRLNNT